MFIVITETFLIIIVAILVFWVWLHWIAITIIVIILVPILMCILFFWGKRGVWFAMKVTYEKVRGYYVRNNLQFSEKELLIKTLQARVTYKQRSLEELTKIVDQNPNIVDLTKFVIKDEGVKSWKEWKN